jgi:RNA polymerase sigma-70 factor (ECF subfamily)
VSRKSDHAIGNREPELAREQQLVQRLRQGEEAAFEEMVRAYSPRLLAVARRFLPEESDAQDALQDAYLSAFKSMGAFEGTSRLTTWLHRITVNACLMKLRSRRRRPERPIGDMLPEFLPDGHQAKPTRGWRPISEEALVADELRGLIRAKIEELPDAYRVVLLLRDIEELSTEEAATLLGLTVSAVKTRLHRARQALRELLEPCMSE